MPYDPEQEIAPIPKPEISKPILQTHKIVPYDPEQEIVPIKKPEASKPELRLTILAKPQTHPRIPVVQNIQKEQQVMSEATLPIEIPKGANINQNQTKPLANDKSIATKEVINSTSNNMMAMNSSANIMSQIPQKMVNTNQQAKVVGNIQKMANPIPQCSNQTFTNPQKDVLKILNQTVNNQNSGNKQSPVNNQKCVKGSEYC